MHAPDQRSRDSSPDAPTIIAIALVAYALASVIHEGLGHGGACLLEGGQALVMSTVHFDCSRDTRWISAAGTIMNCIAGLVCWGASRLARNKTWLRYFLWLLMTVNLLDAAGYFLFSGVGGIGDWADVIRGVDPVWLWRSVLTLFGIVSYLACVWFCLLELGPFLGTDRQGRVGRARKLTVVPYLAGGILSCVAGALNPVGMILVAISAAAASFGGTSGLAWMASLLRNPKITNSELQAPAARRSAGWIVTACMVAALFIALVGPGIRFRH